MDKKRRKDPAYQLAGTARWIVSPENRRVLDKLEKKRARRQAWIQKQKETNHK